MIEKTVRGGYDTWVESANPSKRHPKDPAAHLKSAAEYWLLYMNNPVPRGAICVQATLRYRSKGASSSRTDSVQRAADKWDPKKANWNNKPGVTGTSATVTTGALSDGGLVEADVTGHLQAWAGGAPNRGWRISTDAGTTRKVYSLNAGNHTPTLQVKYTWRPDAPSNLTSSGGAVSVSKPVLQFDYNETSGTSDLAALEVQIDPAANGTSPAWSSGEVSTTVPELDLATTSYPGLSNGATTKWRVRAKSDDGYWSPWSDWVSFTRTAKGVLSIISPGAAPLDYVTEPTPPFQWSFTNQTAFRVVITPADDRTKFLHNSRRQPGADQSYTPPKGVLTKVGQRYSVGIRTWDTVARVSTTGDPTYVEAWRDFTFTKDSTPAPVAWLTVTQMPLWPCAELTFYRATPPDSFMVERNGQVIESDLDPAELTLVAPGQWMWRDWTAPAFTDLEYQVVPVVNHKAAQGGPTQTVKLKINAGVYVIDPDNEWRFNLLGVEQDFHYGEDSTETPKFDFVARKIASIRGLEGGARGVLIQSDYDPRPLDEQLADVTAIKERPLRTYRVAIADVNFPARVGKVDPAPSSDFMDGIEQRSLAFQAWQYGELPFKPQA